MPSINKEDLIETIANMTVLEMSELVKAMEEKFGVSAQAAVAAAAPADSADSSEAAAEEKTSFDVHLTAIGDNKISVIQAVRALTKLGLKESKEMVEKAPGAVLEGIPKEEAEAAVEQLKKAGASAETK